MFMKVSVVIGFFSSGTPLFSHDFKGTNPWMEDFADADINFLISHAPVVVETAVIWQFVSCSCSYSLCPHRTCPFGILAISFKKIYIKSLSA